MTASDIIQELKKKKYRPIYFLQGDETFFIDQIAHYIEKNVLTEAEKSFNFASLYGKETDVDTIITSARRYPMMSEYQIVMVKEAQYIRDINRLIAYAKLPLKSTILVVLYKSKSLRSNTKLAKAIVHQEGVLFTAKKLYDNHIPAWIQRYLRDKKYKITHEATALLQEYLGTDLGKISNELDKLMLNLSADTMINKQHIADNIGVSKDYNVFEFQRALLRKQEGRVYKMVDYFAHNPKAAPFVMLLGNLYRFFSRLYVYHHIKKQQEAKILKALGLRSRYFLNDYQEGSQNYNLLATKNIISLLYEYDLKSKGVDNPSTTSGELLKEMSFRVLNSESSL